MIVGHIGGAGSPYEIQKSLRFRASASAYLSRTYASAGSTTTWTQSVWVKRGALSSGLRDIFRTHYSATYHIGLYFNANDTLSFVQWTGNVAINMSTTQVFRDSSAWYHIVLAVDSTQAIASNRVKLYVNGVQITSFNTATYPTQNSDTYMCSSTGWTHVIGKFYDFATTNYFDGYFSEINFIDGQALDPSYFGQVSAETGAWIPKKYTGTYGTNGFYLPFNDGSTLGNLAADRSGNGNNWTANNISLTAGVTYDWMDDRPGNSYATLNPLRINGGTLSDANSKFQNTSGTTYYSVAATQALAGKTYWEITVTDSTTSLPGVIDDGALPTPGGTDTATLGGTANGYSPRYTKTEFRNNNANIATGLTSFVDGDVLAYAFDADTGKLWYAVNNTWQASGSPSTGVNPIATLSTSKTWFPACSALDSGIGNFNFGQRPFTYSPPAGFKALCTKNLPDPAIKNPKKHFDVVLATGANIKSTVEALYSDQALMVVKDRANANNWQWFNDVTGLSAILQSNTTSAETTYSAPTGSSVGYGWKAGGAPVTNNAGSIQSQVSANPQAGFSIVTYTGTGANATVGHGLGVAPKMVIVKSRQNKVQTESWPVYHEANGNTKYQFLNGTGAAVVISTVWNNTSPTSTVFSVGTYSGVNASTDTYVAYCFAEIPGYSKIGSYVGNGSADGPFVYCGFRPRWVLYKRTDAVSNWYIVDTARNTANSLNNLLLPNSSQAEFAGPAGEYEDFLANGFKLRTTSTDHNALNGTYIFIAFAESPFKYANAR